MPLIDPPQVITAIKELRELSCLPRRALDARQAAALAIIYRHYARSLLAVAHRFRDSGVDAEDVVHDVFSRLPWIIDQYRGGGLGAWLRRVTQREALMQLRRSRRRCLEPIDEHGWSDTVSSNAGAIDTDHTELHVAIAALAPPLREVVMLRIYRDYSHYQIAGALGITPTASEVRLCRAIKQLRVSMQPNRSYSLPRSA
jgi:RNA polymerase sigma-70 factor (ECF subfamily)